MQEPARRRLTGVSRDEASPFNAAMAAQDQHALTMVDAALQARRVRLAFQPVVLGDAPDRVGYWEGLVRVLDETGRVIPARDFMAAVETTETGRLIDCAALHGGLVTLQRQPDLRISINMSARSIGFPKWQRILKRALAADNTLGERLILEISETSALIVPELVSAFMAEMQGAGIAFALDDFGEGMTSFRHLRDFQFDIAKIDGQFVRGVSSNADNQMVVKALMAVARHFDMMTVAESVESEGDADFMQDLGVGAMQGYFYGAPTMRPPWVEALERKRA